MKTQHLTAIALGLSVGASLIGTAGAQTGMKNGSGNASTTKARCSPGDPNVMLNAKTKTYTLDSSAPSPKSAKMSADAGSGAMADAAAAGKNTNMKSLCKSEADSMGAKMAARSSK